MIRDAHRTKPSELDMARLNLTEQIHSANEALKGGANLTELVLQKLRLAVDEVARLQEVGGMSGKWTPITAIWKKGRSSDQLQAREVERDPGNQWVKCKMTEQQFQLFDLKAKALGCSRADLLMTVMLEEWA